jgi:hypothetical protein
MADSARSNQVVLREAFEGPKFECLDPSLRMKLLTETVIFISQCQTRYTLVPSHLEAGFLQAWEGWDFRVCR